MTPTLTEMATGARERAQQERGRGEIASAIQWENIAAAYVMLTSLERRREEKRRENV